MIVELTATCTCCGANKPLEEFPLKKDKLNGRGSHCKSCMAAHSRRYYLAHRSERIKKHSEWTKRNLKTVAQYNRDYRTKNKGLVKRWDKDHYDKRSKDYKYVLCQGIATMIGRQLSGRKGRRKWEDLVGYDLSALTNHIEKQFQPGMSWDNHGRYGWHLDHKIPISAFNFEKAEDIDFKRCWALENLQPLWWRDNITKGDKLQYPFQGSLLMEEGSYGKLG